MVYTLRPSLQDLSVLADIQRGCRSCSESDVQASALWGAGYVLWIWSLPRSSSQREAFWSRVMGFMNSGQTHREGREKSLRQSRISHYEPGLTPRLLPIRQPFPVSASALVSPGVCPCAAQPTVATGAHDKCLQQGARHCTDDVTPALGCEMIRVHQSPVSGVPVHKCPDPVSSRSLWTFIFHRSGGLWSPSSSPLPSGPCITFITMRF